MLLKDRFIGPGAMQFTLILKSETSLAKHLENVSIPDFDAL